MSNVIDITAHLARKKLKDAQLKFFKLTTQTYDFIHDLPDDSPTFADMPKELWLAVLIGRYKIFHETNNLETLLAQLEISEKIFENEFEKNTCKEKK